ncbi:MAG: gluconate 2-dehydrogenase subunit 3 family protein, partial [Opitutaceae bacterium]|nr:gluconate 2-dehydrogenase subunit 3 family protein [Verrucomicrobiales bacterium]
MTPDASTPSPCQPLALSRREAIERILLAATLAASFDLTSFGADAVTGIGADPNLLKKEIPWPRVLTEAEKAIVTALGDLVIPEDDHGPAASRVGIPDFIDEWVSAPYDQQRGELKIIRDGLAWIEV